MSRSISRNLLVLVALLALPSLVLSASVARLAQRHDDAHHAPLRKRVPGTWYQPDSHPAHALFKRGAKRDTSTDGTNYAQVGSPAWSAGYPQGKPDPSKLPQEWVNALNAAVAAGKIPNIPPSTPTGGNPTYGSLDPLGDEVCSTTYKCRKNTDDYIWDAPEGVWGAGFDDGPLPTSDRLYQFLQANDVHATHFFIGVNILNNPTEFTTAYETLKDDIAVHTWTHPYMTTLDNMALLGEFGWTMEIIHNSTGGRLPKYWRPPYGDSDNRVSAIAKEVFGLQTIIWNQDTEDWSIGAPGSQATMDSVHAALTKWITGPKSPGLIVLEHELSNYTVQAFIDAFPLLKSNGWDIVSVAELDGQSAYRNADGDDGTVTPAAGVLVNEPPPNAPSSSSSAPASSTSSAPPSGTPPPGNAAGAKQAGGGGTSSTSSAAPSPTGANQSSAALSLHWPHYMDDMPGLLAAAFTVFVSALLLT